MAHATRAGSGSGAQAGDSPGSRRSSAVRVCCSDLLRNCRSFHLPCQSRASGVVETISMVGWWRCPPNPCARHDRGHRRRGRLPRRRTRPAVLRLLGEEGVVRGNGPLPVGEDRYAAVGDRVRRGSWPSGRVIAGSNRVEPTFGERHLFRGWDTVPIPISAMRWCQGARSESVDSEPITGPSSLLPSGMAVTA